MKDPILSKHLPVFDAILYALLVYHEEFYDVFYGGFYEMNTPIYY